MLNQHFILGGHAIFTVEVPEDAQVRAAAKPHYTFKVSSFEAKDGKTLYSVSLLTAPETYQYVGMVNPNDLTLKMTAKSHFTDDCAPVKLLKWTLKHVADAKDMPVGWKLHHEGRCARCGRTLTTPESIERGFGPECAKMN
jgi:hypothetical protein